jgi:hypothetical protein
MWRGEVMVGYRSDGKPDRRYVYAKTRKGCQEKLDDLRRRAGTGLLPDKGRPGDGRRVPRCVAPAYRRHRRGRDTPAVR